jgi:hypothetical protein
MSNSTETNLDVSYTTTLESFFVETGERAQCLSILHSKASNHYANKHTNINIPIIVISSLTGFFSAGSTTMFAGNMELASILLGISSLIVSVMNTVSSYYGYAKKAEGHRIASLSYAKLFRFISVELALPRIERLRAVDFLKFVKGEIDRLAETAPFVPQSEIDVFKRLFNNDTYKDVAKPYEANGLTKIKIYQELPSLTTGCNSGLPDLLTIRIPKSSAFPIADGTPSPTHNETSQTTTADGRRHTPVAGEQHQNIHESTTTTVEIGR